MNTMSIMSTRGPATPRRARRAGTIASLFVVAALLAGCSAADETYLDSGGDFAYAEEGSANVPAPDADRSKTSDVVQSSEADRAVIITGSMYMTVEDPIVAADRAAGIVKNAGGRVDARSETAPDERNGGSAWLTLRIPSNRLDGVVEDLRGLGTVDQFSTDSYDVTTQVIDLEAQISTLRASTGRIEALLLEAKDISDIITLENELDNRQARLESLEAHKRGLDDQVSMSTLDVSLTTEPVVIIEEEGPENFWDALVSGWEALVGFLAGAAIVLGVMLPWLALIGVLGLMLLVVVRARKSRAARAADAKEVASATRKTSATRK